MASNTPFPIKNKENTQKHDAFGDAWSPGLTNISQL